MTPPVPGSGTELHQIALSVARMEGKLDGVLAQGADHESRLRKLELAGGADHEPRIRSLERALWAVGGAGAVTGGGIAAIISKLTGG